MAALWPRPTEQVILEAHGSWSFAWLQIIQILELALLAIAILSNLVMVYNLRQKYTSLHCHMAVITMNESFVVVLSSVYALIRIITALSAQHQDFDIKEWDPGLGCPFQYVMPSVSYALFCIFPFILAAERFIATRRVTTYESQDFHGLFMRFFALVWLLICLMSLTNLRFLSSDFNSFNVCQLMYARKSMLQRHVWSIIVGSFNIIAALMFYKLYLINTEIKPYTIDSGYSVSIRYQLRENLKTCQFFFHLHLGFGLSFLLPFFFDCFYRICANKEPNDQNALILRELGYLVHACSCSGFGLVLIIQQTKVLSRFRTSLRTFIMQFQEKVHL